MYSHVYIHGSMDIMHAHHPFCLKCPIDCCILRMALVVFLVEAMSGCWLIEQPGSSLLRFHPRVMDLFSMFKVTRLHKLNLKNDDMTCNVFSFAHMYWHIWLSFCMHDCVCIYMYLCIKPISLNTCFANNLLHTCMHECVNLYISILAS